MSVGLDLGTYELRSLRQEGHQLVARRCQSVYSVLPDSEPRRRRLEQFGIPYAACEDHLLIWGESAESLAELAMIRTFPLLPEGAVPRHDPPARQLLAKLIEGLLGPPRQPNEICCLTPPGNTPRSDGGSQESDGFLTRLIRLQGYRPLVVSPGLAVVLAELDSESFTGIGISFGAGTCEMSLAHHGRELARFCSQWPAQTGEPANQGGPLTGRPSGAWRKRGEPDSLGRPALGSLLSEAARELSGVPAIQTITQPVTVVVAGGAARSSGFGELLKQTLRTIPLPVQIGDVRLAADLAFTVARGCLINAEIEAQTQRSGRTAA